MLLRLPALASVVAVGALVLLAAGCGSGTPRGVANLPATTSAASGTLTPTDSQPGGELALYADCMRTHGISNFPDQGAFGSSTAIRTAKGQMAQITQSEAAQPKFQSAQRACAKYYGSPATSPRISPQQMLKLLAVSRCMRGHGVPKFPDANLTGDFPSPATVGIDPNSPQVLAALQACRSLGKAAGLSAQRSGP